MIQRNKFFLQDSISSLTLRVLNITFFLFIFLMPTQLGLHFWPEWSLVSGIRVDYLSPTIYLTDVLLFVLFLVLLLRVLMKLEKKAVKRFKENKRLLAFFFPIFLFSIVNIYLSANRYVSFILWLRVFECVLISLYIIYFNRLKSFWWFYFPITLSSLFFGLLGFLQVVKEATLGGPFYYFGERTFSLNTPGISLFVFNGRQFLRAYSTFPHPNAMGGFLGVVIMTLLIKKGLFKRYKKTILFFLLFFLLITFSKNALFSLLLVSIFYFLALRINRISLARKLIKTVPLVVFIFNLLFLVVFARALNIKRFPQSYSYRLFSTSVSANLLTRHSIFGVGLNNFITSMVKEFPTESATWFLQPVHNVYLLFLAETGFGGYIVLFIFVSLFLRYLIGSGKEEYFFPFLIVILTSFFDHYWITIEQNRFLLAVFVSLVIFEKKKRYN